MGTLLLPVLLLATVQSGDRPNVVLIFADDLGYGDLACYGHPYARTPHLDRLAAEGTRFMQAYVTGITCSPSRTGLMTGRFPATFGKYPADFGFGDRTTVTALLRRRGYATGHCGKWHIGPEAGDGTYGIDSVAEDVRDRSRHRDAPVFDAAIRFVEAHRDGPFYLNVWAHTSHFPITPPQAYVDRFKDVTIDPSRFSGWMQAKFEECRRRRGDIDASMRRYLADVNALDEGVGRLLKRIDDLGLRGNTLVVFSSDHGPGLVEVPTKAKLNTPEQKEERARAQLDMMGYAGELRGGKHGDYEGGVRVPFIVRWPDRVPAGRVDETSVISTIDWLPTLCALTGTETGGVELDGEDVAKAWLGGEHRRTRPLFWKTNSVKSPVCIRDGKWKYREGKGKRSEPELYDLEKDPGERKNVVADHPEVVKTLSARIEAWAKTLPAEYEKNEKKKKK